MAERRFDEREVGSILRRVAELQASQGEGSDSRTMSLGDLEQVAQELGMSKALVARAVSDLSIPPGRGRRVWGVGGKVDLLFEHVHQGRVDDATLTRMLEVLRRHVGDPGSLRTEGDARIWSCTGPGGRAIHFTVVEHDSGTSLRLEEVMPGEAGAVVSLSTIAGGFVGVMTAIPLKALLLKATLMLVLGPIVGLGVVLGWLGGRAVWGRRSHERELGLAQAFDQVLRCLA